MWQRKKGVALYFYPRPPRGGRLQVAAVLMVRHDISIHALREEGDIPKCGTLGGERDFYPRPPRGGRQHTESGGRFLNRFLSTPSARRAT